MGVQVSGKGYESGAPATVIIGEQLITDTGAQWIYAGQTTDGKVIATQAPIQANAEVQPYISANANLVRDEVPSGFTYDQPPVKGWSFKPTGPFTKFDQSDADYVSNTVADADAAAMASTNAGRFGAITAAGANIPSPYSAGLAGASYISTVVGFGADVIGQLLRPDVGKLAISGTTGLIASGLSDRAPGLAPAINETANTLNNSEAGQEMQGALNSYWDNFLEYWKGRQ